MSVCVEFLGFSTYKIISSANRDNILNSSFPIWMCFISFSCLIFLARIPSTMLTRKGKSGPPWLVPYLREKAFPFSPLSVIFRTVFSCMDFILLSYMATLSSLFSVFIMKGYSILSNASSASTEMIVWFFLHSVDVA